MTARLLTGLACLSLSLGCVWSVDPGSRSAAMTARGALWGLAGLAVVVLVRLAVARLRGRRPAQ